MKFEISQKGTIIETKDFGEGSYKIGRSSECDIQLRSPQVSKQHALLVVKGNKAAIVDLGSSNGVFVNGILVRKQRFDRGDEVVIANFKIRFAEPIRSTQKARPSGENYSDDGNLARNIELEPGPSQMAEPAAALNSQERLMLIMDQKVLAPFYAVMKNVDWRMLLLTILGGALVLAVLLSVVPIVRWGREITKNEALARAHTIVTQTVRENYRIIAKTNDFSRMTVEACEAGQGILNCEIIDPKSKTVLAPTKLLNKAVTDYYVLFALNKISDGSDEAPSIERDTGPWVVAEPIYAFSSDANEKVLQAVVVADFEVPAKIYSTFEPLVEAALFAILCSLLAYYFIFKMFTYPILSMHDQLDSALKGEDVTVTSAAKCEELEGLATVINFSLSRIKQGGGIMQPVVASDVEAEAADYERSVQEFDQGMNDGLLLMDKEKKVVFVGHALEDLISMRNQYARGQNISDACKDQGFAGTSIDLADRVVSTLGETQQSILDINGVARTMYAMAHKDRNAEIRFILIIIRLV